MNGKSQEAREDDLLEQVFTQGLEKINSSAQMTVAGKAPPEETPSAPGQEGGGNDAPPADRKSRQSAVYLYLLILFGAAFLMLLLAYFVQQRSSEDAYNDLRESMNLSRQDLLAQISAGETRIATLKEQNESLREQLDRMDGNLSQLQKRYDEQAQDANIFYEQLIAAQLQLREWESLWTLEQFYQAEDLKSCAAILLFGMYANHTPAGTEQRYEEIVKAVIRAGILDEDYLLHPEDYSELLDDYLSSIVTVVQPEQWME